MLTKVLQHMRPHSTTVDIVEHFKKKLLKVKYKRKKI